MFNFWFFSWLSVDPKSGQKKMRNYCSPKLVNELIKYHLEVSTSIHKKVPSLISLNIKYLPVDDQLIPAENILLFSEDLPRTKIASTISSWFWITQSALKSLVKGFEKDVLTLKTEVHLSFLTDWDSLLTTKLNGRTKSWSVVSASRLMETWFECMIWFCVFWDQRRHSFEKTYTGFRFLESIGNVPFCRIIRMDLHILWNDQILIHPRMIEEFDVQRQTELPPKVQAAVSCW